MSKRAMAMSKALQAAQDDVKGLLTDERTPEEGEAEAAQR